MSEPSAPQGLASLDRGAIFDPVAPLYSLVFPLIWRVGFPHLHHWLAHELDDAEDVLDAGTGPGYWARFAAATRPRRRVVGVDLSARFLELARRRGAGPEVEFVKADMTELPFAAGSFDAIVCSGVLDTLPRPELALREFRRVLRPEGRVLLILRGGRPGVSRAMEWIFRAGVAAPLFLSRRSGRRGAGFDAHWERGQIWPRLSGLAEPAGLTVVALRPGWLAATVSLRRRTEPEEER